MQNNTPEKGETWRHYKYDKEGVENNYTYEIVDLVFDAGSDYISVLYRPLYECDHLKKLGVKWYVRNLENFLERVEKGGYNGPRFVKIR